MTTLPDLEELSTILDGYDHKTFESAKTVLIQVNNFIKKKAKEHI